MSDFLSNFTNNNYSEEKEKSKKKEVASDKKAPVSDEQLAEVSQETQALPPQSQVESATTKPTETEEVAEEETVEIPSRVAKTEQQSRFQEEETEFDPNYRKQQNKKRLLIGGIVALSLILLFTIYYQLSHVKVPNFVGENLTDVRQWSKDEGVELKVEQEYNFEQEVNVVIKQTVAAGKKIKKGKTLVINASLGPDPEEQLTLPTFSKMNAEAAKEWIEENKAENISLIQEYDEKIEKGNYIKEDFSNKDLDPAAYRRKDKLSVYYSKGKEPREKNIEVTDWVGKTRAEVADWAKKNEVKLEVEEVFSDSKEAGQVISQTTEKGSKIAKKDTFTIQVSKGKAIEVPDYSQYTVEEAASAGGSLPAQIKSIYTADLPYGRFISQSVEAGKQYSEKDSLPTVRVYYSEGQPYMKDLRGSVNEGDLQKIFFDEFQSKGADITYNVYYVDSSQSKGTVVEMSTYSQFVALDAHITIGISKGNLDAPPAEYTGTDGGDVGGQTDTEGNGNTGKVGNE